MGRVGVLMTAKQAGRAVEVHKFAAVMNCKSK